MDYFYKKKKTGLLASHVRKGSQILTRVLMVHVLKSKPNTHALIALFNRIYIYIVVAMPLPINNKILVMYQIMYFEAYLFLCSIIFVLFLLLFKTIYLIWFNIAVPHC